LPRRPLVNVARTVSEPADITGTPPISQGGTIRSLPAARKLANQGGRFSGTRSMGDHLK